MMKKCLLLLLMMLLFAGIAPADTLPPDLLRLHIAYPEDVTDCLVYDLADGRQLAVTYGPWGSLDGYLREEDTWTMQFMLSGAAANACLRREDDVLSFALVGREDGRLLESWAWTGDGIRRTGWACQGEWTGSVTMQDRVMTFTGADGTVSRVPWESDWPPEMVDHDRLPMSPGEAEALLAVSPGHVTQYPDFDLVSCDVGNEGQETEARYVRLQDGCVTFRTDTLRAGEGVVSSVDSMPVPVTATLAEEVAQRGAESVFRADDTGRPFALAAWLDRERIPVTGEVLQSDAQACGLLLLTEEAGVRRLCFVTRSEAGDYVVQTSLPLPGDTWLDLYHAGAGEVQPETGGMQVGYRLDMDGVWHLSWLMGPDFTADVGFGRVTLQDGDEVRLLGSLPGGDLMRTGLAELPGTAEGLIAAVQCDGWAVVNNPDPKDRLNLRRAPDRKAESLGRFYNGVVVRVLERRGDWTRVSLDRDGLLTGWMMTKYLAFGAEGTAVREAAPVLFVREHVIGHRAMTDPWMTDAAPLVLTGREQVIGLCGAEGRRPASWIVRSPEGQTGYVPLDWLWEGNG